MCRWTGKEDGCVRLEVSPSTKLSSASRNLHVVLVLLVIRCSEMLDIILMLCEMRSILPEHRGHLESDVSQWVLRETPRIAALFETWRCGGANQHLGRRESAHTLGAAPTSLPHSGRHFHVSLISRL